MPEFTTLLQQGNAWLFIPSAILLGALHGLEPGHSKTMMAAFIVAIRGTMTQAVLLGLSATLSHTAVVWAVAMAGLYFGSNWDAETTEPYFQFASAVLIVGVAGWMIWRTWRGQHHDHDHDHLGHAHGHDHAHGHAHHSDHDVVHQVDTGHGRARLALFEEGVPPRFRLYPEGAHGHDWAADRISLETERDDQRRERFTFVQRDGYLESAQVVPEPHAFVAHLQVGDATHSHAVALAFHESSDPAHLPQAGLTLPNDGYQDAHERAHAEDIRRRFAGREVTTGQIVVFGLTGGLIPCPASITVLLLCLQLKKIALGATLVLSFSVGLALTMVMSGALAALSVRHVSTRWSGFGEFTRKAPYFSAGLIMLVGLYVGYQGLHALM